MATLNLGRIKPVFQGAYNGSTAYVVDDIVTFGDETFICIQASTGNATSNASYWTKLAAKGTDGTDVGTTLTTQGDILYRDGSGLQRLAAGTNGQVLQTGGSGANPSWGSVASDMVKLASGSFDTSASTLDIQNCFSGTYEIYKLYMHYYIGTSDGNNYPELGFLDASNNHISDTYYALGDGSYNTSGSGNSRWTNSINQDNFEQNDNNGYRLINTWQTSKSDEMSMCDITLIRPDRAAKCMMMCDYGSSQHNYVAQGRCYGMHDTSTVRKGIRINSAGGTNWGTGSKYYLYGIKP